MYDYFSVMGKKKTMREERVCDCARSTEIAHYTKAEQPVTYMLSLT